MPSSERMKLIVVGSGPAGIFAAICAAKAAPGLEVVVLEREAVPLRWMSLLRTPLCFARDGDDLERIDAAYPRGGDFIRGALQAFPASQLREWLAEAGILTEVENGAIMPAPGPGRGRVGEALLAAAAAAGVRVECGVAAGEIAATSEGFKVWMKSGPSNEADIVLLATGGRDGRTGWGFAKYFGHTVVEPVPSPVLLQSHEAFLRSGSPVEVATATARLPEFGAEARGGVSLLPQGVGGPAVLELTSRYARELAQAGHKCLLQINWTAHVSSGQPTKALRALQQSHAFRELADDPAFDLPPALWRRLVESLRLPEGVRWGALTPAQLQTLAGKLSAQRLKMQGRCVNKEEWVMCGGVPLAEVDPCTMQSRRRGGLYLVGEMLDYDGLTGGWNMHAALATAWIAAGAISSEFRN
jgi:hypothetical protein